MSGAAGLLLLVRCQVERLLQGRRTRPRPGLVLVLALLAADDIQHERQRHHVAQDSEIPPPALLRCGALGGSGGGKRRDLKEQRRDDDCTFHDHLLVRYLKEVNTSRPLSARRRTWLRGLAITMAGGAVPEAGGEKERCPVGVQR